MFSASSDRRTRQGGSTNWASIGLFRLFSKKTVNCCAFRVGVAVNGMITKIDLGDVPIGGGSTDDFGIKRALYDQRLLPRGIRRARDRSASGPSRARLLVQPVANWSRRGWVEETCNRRNRCAPNGLEVNPRGQGPRGYGSAAHGLPACESRDAGRAPPCRF